ncbi:hypothetical protein DT380_00435, partial [Pseudomonas aeruginosa]
GSEMCIRDMCRAYYARRIDISTHFLLRPSLCGIHRTDIKMAPPGQMVTIFTRNQCPQDIELER